MFAAYLLSRTGKRGLIYILSPCQHDDSCVDGRSQIKVHTDERTQVHSARSLLMVTHPSTNQGRLNARSLMYNISEFYATVYT